MLKFNNELLSTDVFSCKYCKNLLKPPVVLIENVGNVCSACKDTKPDNNKLIINDSLNVLIEKLYFWCEFKSRGCAVQLPRKELEEHKRTCSFRTVRCIFSSFNNCNWNGNNNEYLEHLVEDHDEHVLVHRENYFYFDTWAWEESQNIKILKAKTGTFIFKSIINKNVNLLLFKIYDLENEATNCNISYKLQGSSGNVVKLSCKVVRETDDDAFNKKNCTAVDLQSLMHIIDTENVIHNVIKICHVDDVKEIEESMLCHFECPVCNTCMKPPIYQCNSGHSVCKNCKPKLDKCPTCRTFFGNCRNFSLESLTTRIQYPCAYQDSGCKKVLRSDAISNHEANCQFKPYNCIFASCIYFGNKPNFIEHLKVNHNDKVILKHEEKFTIPFHMDKYSTMKRNCMICYDEIFRLSYKQALDYTYWGVEVFGEQNNPDNYIYEIGLIDLRKEEKRVIRTDTCLKQLSDEELMRKCSAIPNNIVMSFVNNSKICYYVKVTKNEKYTNSVPSTVF